MPEAILNLVNFSWAKSLFLESKKPQFSIFDLPDRSKILDVSCGEGNLLYCLQNHNQSLKLHGLDISKKAIETAKERFPKISFLEGRAEELPFLEKSFKAVVTSMALHHYKNPKQVFAEVARVLEPKGLCYVIDYVPKNKWAQWVNNLCGCHEPYHFEKYYTREEIENLAGFQGLKLIAQNKMNFIYAQTRLVFVKNN